MSEIEQKFNELGRLVASLFEERESQEQESPKENQSNLPPLLDAKEVMSLYKIKDSRTFTKKLRNGLIPPVVNPEQRKRLWNRDVILNSINNG